MKNKNVYLATVDRDFNLNDEVLEYFRSKDVEVVKYLEKINVLQLSSPKDLSSENLKYVRHIEKSKIMRSGSSKASD